MSEQTRCWQPDDGELCYFPQGDTERHAPLVSEPAEPPRPTQAECIADLIEWLATYVSERWQMEASKYALEAT
jgi:hypothetical protein